MLKKLIIPILLVVYFSLFFLQRIKLATADLGRHIINGKVFVEQRMVVSENFYSYTEPNFPVVTHHWLSGVIFYAIQSLVGFTGLSLFYILISGLTVYFFFKVAERKSNFYTALLFTLLLIPVMANRREVRPEGFSYLLLGIYLYVFELFKDKQLPLKKLLLIVLPLQVLWINLHIFFIMGIFISGVYFSFSFLEKKRVKEYSYVLFLMVLVSLANPYFIRGLLEPLNIFKEYGYMIVENQPILFMQKRSPSLIYLVIEFSTLVLVWMLISIYSVKGSKRYFHYVIFSLVFLVLSYKAIRGIPMYAMFFVPLLSLFFSDKIKIKKEVAYGISGLIFIMSIIPNNYFSIKGYKFGIGLDTNVNAAADFYKSNKLKGPIFNNYDIGGYLIYHLYGQEEVFVDNRPEAYSVDFLQNVYMKAQELPEIWQGLEEQYNFNTIFFYRNDITQFAQPFLIERIKDPTWVPVFVDDYNLILVKDNEHNKDIIEQYELPKEIFIVR